MEEKVYVIRCSSGEYEGKTEWIGGCFNNREMAENAKEVLNKRAKDIIDNNPIKKSFMEMTNKEMAIYNKYAKGKEYELYWNDAHVEEFNLNEIVY
jgi:hypothetical protein